MNQHVKGKRQQCVLTVLQVYELLRHCGHVAWASLLQPLFGRPLFISTGAIVVERPIAVTSDVIHAAVHGALLVISCL
jgi:hypothetical protein